jgi:hypothetical protein
MRRTSIFSIALAGVCQAAVAHAAITSRDTTFTSVCIDEAATAFEWKAGKWVLIPYYPNRYDIRKLAAAATGCADILKAKTDLSATFDNINYGCYRITPFAQDTTPPIACVESWSGPDGDAALDNVTCAGDTPYHWVVFQPSGTFQFTQLNPDFSDSPPGGVKDLLILSVGKCTIERQR